MKLQIWSLLAMSKDDLLFFLTIWLILVVRSFLQLQEKTILGTLKMAADKLIESGATEVYAIVTHGIFSRDAIDKINSSKIKFIAVTNSMPQEKAMKQSNKVKIIDISGILAETIRRTHNGESVCKTFQTNSNLFRFRISSPMPSKKTNSTQLTKLISTRIYKLIPHLKHLPKLLYSN